MGVREIWGLTVAKVKKIYKIYQGRTAD